MECVLKMAEFTSGGIPVSPRIPILIENLFKKMPEIEADCVCVALRLLF